MWPIDHLINAVGGTPFQVEKQSFSGISTDSRTIERDQFFVPLKGPHFDGHLFMDKAYEKSGGGSLCDKTRPEIFERAGGTIILVNDTNQALLDLAKFRRGRTSAIFVGITGSNGKTTTKELLVHMIGNAFPIAFNERNFNNRIGVAKTLIAIEGSPRYAVVEMGTNHRGEMAVLAEMVRPLYSLITNVNPSHLEGFCDVEGVREEKLSLFESTLDGGKLFINADDPGLAKYTGTGNRTRSLLKFAVREEADYVLRVTQDRGLEGFDIRLLFPGTTIDTSTILLGHHNLYDVLAAAALAHSMGVGPDRLKEAIPSFEPYKGRFSPMKARRGYTVIDDSYNANPSSMEWAVNTLAALPCRGRRIAIVGDMKELGDKESFYHRELGHFLRNSNVSLTLLLGEATRMTLDEMDSSQARFFDSKKELIEFAAERIDAEDIVLVKGSRALGMDEITEALI